MSYRNAGFYRSTRHWRAEELANYIVAAARLLQDLSDLSASDDRGRVLSAQEPRLHPLVIWAEDNLREEIVFSLRAWNRADPVRLLEAYKIMAEQLSVRPLQIGLQLLVETEFMRGETLAFTLAAKRSHDKDRDALQDLGLTLIYLCGLEAGAGSGMTLAYRFAILPGMAASPFVEAAARVAADRTPSMLADALDAVGQAWDAEKTSEIDAQDFLDDIRLRVDASTLARAFDRMRSSPTSLVLRGALRLFSLKDLVGPDGSDASTGTAAARSPTGAIVFQIARQQGRRFPRPSPAPNTPLANRLWARNPNLANMRPEGNG